MAKEIIVEQKKNKKQDVFMKVLSLVVSIGLWLYVVYSENPVREVWVRNIPITYKNVKVLENNSLVMIKNETKNASVKINGRRRDVLLLNNDTATASIDFSGIKEAGQYNLPVTVSFPIDSVSITDKNPYNISVTIDKIAQIAKSVTVNYIGTPKEGCTYEPAILSTKTATISGPSSLLSSVSSVIIDVDVSGISESIELTAQPKLIFKDGFENNAEYIKCETSSIKVQVPVGVSKTVPVIASFDAPLTLEPQSVEITGPADIVANIQNILTENIEFSEGENSKTVALVLPEGVVANTENVIVSLPPEIQSPTEEINEEE